MSFHGFVDRFSTGDAGRKIRCHLSWLSWPALLFDSVAVHGKEEGGPLTSEQKREIEKDGRK